MQCPHCQFENLDEKVYCVRCGKLMRIADVDTVPPRAKGKFLNFLLFLYALRRAYGFRWKRLDIPGKKEETVEYNFDPPLLLTLLVPSVFQFSVGRKKRGRCFLGIFLTGILLFVLLIGSYYWNIAFLVTAAAYTGSITDAFYLKMNRLLRFIVAFGISLFVYTVAYSLMALGAHVWIISQGIQIPAYYTEGDLLYGDIVEVVRQDEYKPGDIVQTRNNPMRRLNGNIHGAVIVHGIIFDRILAGPGESVEIKNNQLHYTGNDKPFPFVPLRARWQYPDVKSNLTKNQYMLIPSYFNIMRNPRYNIAIMPPIIDQSDIDGKVTRIKYPLWRRKTFR